FRPSVHPSFQKFLAQRRVPQQNFRVAFGVRHQDADPPHLVRLLRPRGERPAYCTAEKRDELTPLHSITSSARASRVGGTSRPSARAVMRLITSSNLLACTTGRSAGLAPLRIRPA